MSETTHASWYQNWFNSPYYHILYKHRDDTEAELFIDNLCALIEVPRGARILDVACGRGRHAIYLNKKGLDVTGIDLSEDNIKHASRYANSSLNFYVHDMRNNFHTNYFDFVFNLFTSFGYFDREKDNPLAMKMFSNALKPGGKLILDFLNIRKTEKNLVEREVKEIQGIEFHISRKIEDSKIIKDIVFEDRGRNYHFSEHVRALSKTDFEKYFSQAGLKPLELYGDYELAPFNENQSDRLIFICQKS